MRITGNAAQQVVAESKNTRNRMILARTTQNTDIQETLSESKNIGVLRALAANPNLHSDVEVTLAETGHPAIVRALLSRTVK